MATFTHSELTTRQIVGIAAVAGFSIAAISCHVALGQGVGVPEFLITARGICWTGAVVGCVWTGLASALKELSNN